MTRRPAAVTQADVARVARVARDLGPPWYVEVAGSVIRLVRGGEFSPQSPERATDVPVALLREPRL